MLAVLGGVLLWQSLHLRQRVLFLRSATVLLGQCRRFAQSGLSTEFRRWLEPVFAGVAVKGFALVVTASFSPDQPVAETVSPEDQEGDERAPTDWLSRFFTPQPLHPVSVVRQPLGQVLILLWLVGFGQLAVYLFNQGLTPAWP
ncbi:MAG: hypothetical protein R3F37_09130 [Candidatus Competibacteraceae bacterium]